MQIFIVNSDTINAFVAGGQRMFINTGLMMAAEDVTELIGVIAHETGHIAGGHLARGVQELERARRTALLTTLLGVAAGIASGSTDVGVALATGGTGVAGRQFLSFSRTMESSADQAALRYLDSAGYSSEGLANFLERLAEDELVPEEFQSEYVRTHPLTRDRVNTVRAHVDRSPLTSAAVSPGVAESFIRMRAKLAGFLQPKQALQTYANDPSTAGRYAHAIALYRTGDLEGGLSGINELIAQEPNNAFFFELKGQMLMENGRLSEALPAYEAAMDLAPNEPLIEMAFAQAALQGNDPQLIDRAINALESATRTPDGGTP
ncbi:MAG: M48 family metalloprotease, partial [Pseudomonadota bacterium]